MKEIKKKSEVTDDQFYWIQRDLEQAMDENIRLGEHLADATQAAEDKERELEQMTTLALDYLTVKEMAMGQCRSIYFGLKEFVQGDSDYPEPGDYKHCAGVLQYQYSEATQRALELEGEEPEGDLFAALSRLRRKVEQIGDNVAYEEAAEEVCAVTDDKVVGVHAYPCTDPDCVLCEKSADEECVCKGKDGTRGYEEGICINCGRSLEGEDDEDEEGCDDVKVADGFDEPCDCAGCSRRLGETTDEEDNETCDNYKGRDVFSPNDLEPSAAGNRCNEFEEELEKTRDTLSCAVRIVADAMVTGRGISDALDVAIFDLAKADLTSAPAPRIDFLTAVAEELRSMRKEEMAAADREYATPERLDLTGEAHDILKKVAETIAGAIGQHICWDGKNGG